MGLALFARTLRTSLRPTNSLPKPKNAIGFTRLQLRTRATSSWQSSRWAQDLVSGQGDVLSSQLHKLPSRLPKTNRAFAEDTARLIAD